MENDPFRYHPRLRGLIADPMQSYFRDFRPSDLDEFMAEQGLPPDWRLTFEDREASRRATLEGRRDADLWVFAYGSLMWDPAILFEEVRRAFVPTHARRFILRDTIGARGDAAAPGLMAALDEGPGCQGLVFRIAQDRLEDETFRLWSRERSVPAYREEFICAETDHGDVTALTFVANHEADAIAPDLTRDEQVRYLATGTGFLGSSMEYIANLAAHFDALRIDDPEVEGLLAEAQALAATLDIPGGP